MDAPVDSAAKQLAWDLGTRKSVEVHVSTEIIRHGDGDRHGDGELSPRDFDKYTEHYIETAAGQRFCEFQGFNQGKLMLRSMHFGDGSRYADVDYDRRNPETQKIIHINHEYWTEGQDDHKQVPAPLSYLYVGREPLPEALSKAQSLGQGEVMGRECNIFLFTDVRSRVRDQVFYLDQETSIPLRVESFKDQASRDKKEPISVWTAQSLDQVQGHFVTLESTSTRYGEGGTPRITWNFNVESIKFDKDRSYAVHGQKVTGAWEYGACR